MAAKWKNVIVLFAFGVACLFSAAYMTSNVGNSIYKSVSLDSGEFGPIVTEKPNQVVEIVVAQSVLPLWNWAWMGAEVYNEHGEYLFSYSDEYWHESGHDSDGHWDESHSQTDFTLTFKEPGKYYIYFDVEGKFDRKKFKQLFVTANYENGSVVLFLWGGILAILIGFAMISTEFD